jgi:hypothetical protein
VSSSAALHAVIVRHAQLAAMLNGRLELTPAESRRIKTDMRGAARIAELRAMQLLLVDHGVRTRSTRQLDIPEFDDLPYVRDVAARHGIELPGFVFLTDEEIDAHDEYDDELAADDDDEPTDEPTGEPIVNVTTELL